MLSHQTKANSFAELKNINYWFCIRDISVDSESYKPAYDLYYTISYSGVWRNSWKNAAHRLKPSKCKCILILITPVDVSIIYYIHVFSLIHAVNQTV